MLLESHVTLLNKEVSVCYMLRTVMFLDLITVIVFGVDLGGLVVSVLATGPKVRGFDPDRGRWIFKGDKNLEHHFLQRGSKAVGPMFTACKRTLRA
jgi:hypothetical protein